MRLSLYTIHVYTAVGSPVDLALPDTEQHNNNGNHGNTTPVVYKSTCMVTYTETVFKNPNFLYKQNKQCDDLWLATLNLDI